MIILSIIFKLIRKIVVATLLIYSFDVFSISLGLVIPINFINIILVSLFDFSALVGLFVFSLIL